MNTQIKMAIRSHRAVIILSIISNREIQEVRLKKPSLKRSAGYDAFETKPESEELS
jgi:hypothetical protein